MTIIGYDVVGGTTTDTDAIAYYFTETIAASVLSSVFTYCGAVSGTQDIETAIYDLNGGINLIGSASNTTSVNTTDGWKENTWSSSQALNNEDYFLAVVGDGDVTYYYDTNLAHVNYTSFSAAGAWATRWPDPANTDSGSFDLDFSIYADTVRVIGKLAGPGGLAGAGGLAGPIGGNAR
jgi:hypothetical protein